MFISLDTVNEFEFYNENSLLTTIMAKAPYNMQSSMQVTWHLRMKRIIRADLDALGMKSYDDIVERMNTYSEFD